MKLEVGMYVRTKNGAIAKIEQIVDDEIHFNIKPIFSDGECLGYNWFYIKDVVKASHNIIDLIQEGDILKINDYKDTYTICEVEKFKNPYFPLEKFLGVRHNNKTKRLYEIPLINLKILTKEQFEAMKYEIS